VITNLVIINHLTQETHQVFAERIFSNH